MKLLLVLAIVLMSCVSSPENESSTLFFEGISEGIVINDPEIPKIEDIKGFKILIQIYELWIVPEYVFFNGTIELLDCNTKKLSYETVSCKDRNYKITIEL